MASQSLLEEISSIRSSSGIEHQDVFDNVDCVEENVEVLEELNWCQNVLSCLLQDHSTDDVMFVTSDGGSVSGHKAILAASSPVLCAMFSDNVHTSGEIEIPLPLVDAETFSSLVSYIYTGKVAVNSATCLDTLGAAMHFNITSLVTNLIIFTTASINSSNVNSVVVFAWEKSCGQLLENCLKFMQVMLSMTKTSLNYHMKLCSNSARVLISTLVR